VKGKKVVLLAFAFVALVLGVIVYSSMNTAAYRVEVCIDYEGRSSCRTAGASTEAEALRTAVTNACAQIASGMTDSINCGNTQPRSVKWLAGK
jgi:hypothetical protein